MSGQKPVCKSFLYGRPVTEWSTLPTFSRTARSLEKHESSTVCDELSQLTLDTAVTEVQSAHNTAADDSVVLDDNHLFSSELSHSKPHYHKHSRQKHENSCGTQIPTALVTPLPGTSPPQQIHDQPPDCMTRHQHIKLEPKGVWRGRNIVEQSVLGGPPTTSDNTVELIEKWKGLIDMKDVILKQKNLQIERQKMTISKLQQDMCELEAKLHHQIVAHIHQPSTSVLETRLQALDAENSSIKAQLADALSLQNKEICTISRELDQKECELYRAITVHKQSSERSQQLISSLQVEIKRQQACIKELEQKLIASDAAVEHHMEQIDRLTKYMGHMPSMDEHQALEVQNRELQIQCEIMAKRLAETEIALKNSLRTTSEKDLLIQSKECIQKELEETRGSLETHKQKRVVLEAENEKLKKECQHLQKVVVEAERRCRQELQAMRERHRARFVEATAKLRSQYKNLAKRARVLESQLTKNSDAMMALNGELQSSQGTIGALKTSVKDLVLQNQELLENNISLQESNAEALKVSSSLSEVQSSAAQQLCFELSQCTDELESLVGLSISLLKGQEPSPTFLFGSESRAMPPDEDASGSVVSSLAQVKCLRQKIEDLRSMVSEHFATQLSSVCNVQ